MPAFVVIVAPERDRIDEDLVACARERDVRCAGTEYLVIGMRSDGEYAHVRT